MCHFIPPSTWQLGVLGGPRGVWKWCLSPSGGVHGSGSPAGRWAGCPTSGPEGGFAGRDPQDREASHCPGDMNGGGRCPWGGGGRCGKGVGGHDVQDPALQTGDPSVHAGFLGLSTADAPADDPCQIKHSRSLLAGQGAPRVTLREGDRAGCDRQAPHCGGHCQDLPNSHSGGGPSGGGCGMGAWALGAGAALPTHPWPPLQEGPLLDVVVRCVLI